MKYQKPYRWKSKKIYGENEGWMRKIQENVGQTIQMTHFLAIFLPFRFLLEKQHRSVKNCPNFSKINFFTLFCQNFTCFPSFFPPFFLHLIQFSLPSPYFSFCGQISLRSIYPLGDAHPSPLPPSTFTRIRSFLCSPFFIFLVYLLRIFINNLTFIEKFHK